eukprot:maker-scaffold_3-snap-gene-7.42-mRNA-1 protein AED:0.20 eAED:0.20 QI:0/0.4/0.16/0.83/1/1/6/0/622
MCEVCYNKTVCNQLRVTLDGEKVEGLEYSENERNYFVKSLKLIEIEEKFTGKKHNSSIREVWNLINIRKMEKWMLQFCSRSLLSKLSIGDYVTICVREKQNVTFSGTIVGLDSSSETKILEIQTIEDLALGFLKLTKFGSMKTFEKNFIRKLGFVVTKLFSSFSFSYMRTSLSRMMENSDKASSLRNLLVKNIKSEETNGFENLDRFSCDNNILLKKLTKDQEEVCERILRKVCCTSEPRFGGEIVQGLPGCGKSTTLAILIVLLLEKNKKVLICSYTHCAVDSLLQKIRSHTNKHDNRILRIGSSFSAEMFPDSIKTEANILEAEQADHFFSQDGFLVASTLLGLPGSVAQDKDFDVCLIDESSQFIEPLAYSPLLKSNYFILVGDHLQLKPIVHSPAAYELSTSIFEKLFVHYSGKKSSQFDTFQLTKQFRMNKTLMDMCNYVLYSEHKITLQPGSATVSSQKVCFQKKLQENFLHQILAPKNEVVVLGYETVDENKERINKYEAKWIMNLLKELEALGFCLENVSILTPYRKQVKLLRSQTEHCFIPKPRVSTIDRYQGLENDVIFLSLVETCIERQHLLMEKLRINVALSRAKCKLIVIGNLEVMRNNKALCNLLSTS